MCNLLKSRFSYFGQCAGSEQLTCGGYLEKSTFRVLIVDDHEPWRNFIRSSLQKWLELQIVGEASERILFCSENLSPDTAEEALRVGAGGYLVKSDAANDLLSAATSTIQGSAL